MNQRNPFAPRHRWGQLSELLSDLPGSQSMNVGGTQRLSTDAPVAAADFVKDNDGVRPQGLAFDSNHGVRQLGDDLLFLCRGEDALNHFHLDQWHVLSPLSNSAWVSSAGQLCRFRREGTCL